MRNLLALTLVAACAGCGSDNGNPGGGDAGNDFAVSFDLAPKPADLSVPADLTTPPDFSGINCGPQTCSAGNVCCAMQTAGTAMYMCASSCVDGGITITCDGPDNCKTGGANICCGDVTLTGGPTLNMCSIQAVAACASTCPISTPLQCPSNWKVQLCHRKADCAAATGHTDCCFFTYNGNNISMCSDATLKAGSTMCFN
jgi:hypothetical protein